MYQIFNLLINEETSKRLQPVHVSSIFTELSTLVSHYLSISPLDFFFFFGDLADSKYICQSV